MIIVKIMIMTYTRYSFMYNITVDSENRARGCANLDIPLEELLAKPMTEQVLYDDNDDDDDEDDEDDEDDYGINWNLTFTGGSL